MDQFRFHMTLTGRLHSGEEQIFRAALETRLAPLIEQAVSIDSIYILRQETPDGNFVLAGRYPLCC